MTLRTWEFLGVAQASGPSLGALVGGAPRREGYVGET